MKKQLFQMLGLSIIAIITTIMSLSYLRSGTVFSFGFMRPNTKQESVQAPALREAKIEYTKAKSANIDFSQSPCLSAGMPSGYSLDIIHDPRIIQDDQTTCPTNSVGVVEIYPDGQIANITRFQ